jgi:hypothetical protein
MESRITIIIMLASLLFLFGKVMSAVAAEPICHEGDYCYCKIYNDEHAGKLVRGFSRHYYYY